VDTADHGLPRITVLTNERLNWLDFMIIHEPRSRRNNNNNNKHEDDSNRERNTHGVTSRTGSRDTVDPG